MRLEPAAQTWPGTPLEVVPWRTNWPPHGNLGPRELEGPTRDRLRAQWHKDYARLSVAEHPWALVTGPLSATIATVMDLGWHPSEPDRWASADRTMQYEMPPTGWNPKRFEKELLGVVEAQLWRKASREKFGLGLEGGADLTMNRTLLETWAKEDERAMHTMALKVSANCCWTEEDRYRAGLIASPLCRRCGRADGTSGTIFGNARRTPRPLQHSRCHQPLWRHPQPPCRAGRHRRPPLRP